MTGPTYLDTYRSALDAAGVQYDVYDVDALPEPVRRMRDLIMEACVSGDVERLRYILRMQRDHYLPRKIIREHLDAIDAANEKLENFRILKSAEVDILEDGKLLACADLSSAYTPSFALIGAESIIMEQSDLGRATPH